MPPAGPPKLNQGPGTSFSSPGPPPSPGMPRRIPPHPTGAPAVPPLPPTNPIIAEVKIIPSF